MPDARPGLTPLRAPRRLFAVPGIIRILFCSPSVPFVRFVSLPLSLSLPNYDYFPIVLELELELGDGGGKRRRNVGSLSFPSTATRKNFGETLSPQTPHGRVESGQANGQQLWSMSR